MSRLGTQYSLPCSMPNSSQRVASRKYMDVDKGSASVSNSTNNVILELELRTTNLLTSVSRDDTWHAAVSMAQ